MQWQRKNSLRDRERRAKEDNGNILVLLDGCGGGGGGGVRSIIKTCGGVNHI